MDSWLWQEMWGVYVQAWWRRAVGTSWGRRLGVLMYTHMGRGAEVSDGGARDVERVHTHKLEERSLDELEQEIWGVYTCTYADRSGGERWLPRDVGVYTHIVEEKRTSRSMKFRVLIYTYMGRGAEVRGGGARDGGCVHTRILEESMLATIDIFGFHYDH